MAKEVFNHEEVIEEFETLTKYAANVQLETLQKILEKNGEAEYLQKLGLNGKTDPETFKSCVPVIGYEDVQPYIQRIMDGDFSKILTYEPIRTFTQSTGTTQGKPKYLPFGEQIKKSIIQSQKTSYAFRNREFPIVEGKALQFIYRSKSFETEEGLTISRISSDVLGSSEYKNLTKDMKAPSCSPEEVFNYVGPDFQQPLYCQLLCGLLCREEIQLLYSVFAHNMILAFRMFGQVWENMCNDIRNGVLSSHIMDPSLRDAMSKLLNSPQPELADFVLEKCIALKDNDWYGMVPELFPNVKYVHSIFTGGMEPYVPKVKHYTGGVLPLVSADYAASEVCVGANVNPRMPPESVTFAVLPNVAYFEFLPRSVSFDSDETPGMDTSVTNLPYAEPEPVGLTEVKVGEEYEVVITNFYGLYRYRLGDIVRVNGFHNSSPELQYVCRKSTIMPITAEKITERDVQLAVEEATKLLVQAKVELVDFSSHVHRPAAGAAATAEGHYVIFWEITSEEAIDDVLQECCNFLDHRFFVDLGYLGYRRTGQIGPLELRMVKRGTFRKLLDHFLSRGASLVQFKTPRSICCAINQLNPTPNGSQPTEGIQYDRRSLVCCAINQLNPTPNGSQPTEGHFLRMDIHDLNHS